MLNAGQAILSIISSVAKLEPIQIDTNKSLNANGLDSLNIVVVREEIERNLRITISDAEWLSFLCINDIIKFTGNEPTAKTKENIGLQGIELTNFSRQEGVIVFNDGSMSSTIEIGMPLTGRNHLAEGPFLQRLGDLRWSHMCKIAGVQSKNFVDEDGNRLYSTFFYVEMAFSERRPMASYGENDRIKVVGNMERFGTSMLDGTFYLMPENHDESEAHSFKCIDQAVAAGIPAVRLSNIFVMQFSGSEWLRKSRPSNPGFERIAEAAIPPESYTYLKSAEKQGCFAGPPQGYVPLTDGPVNVEYKLVPDRDLNGAGLVYFANYPVFLDICERTVLESCKMALTDDLINRRTLVTRKSAYLNNASAKDTLRITVEPWIENPYLKGAVDPEMEPIRLFVNCHMYRESDQRLMMVSTVQKIIFGRTVEDLPFCKLLQNYY